MLFILLYIVSYCELTLMDFLIGIYLSTFPVIIAFILQLIISNSKKNNKILFINYQTTELIL